MNSPFIKGSSWSSTSGRGNSNFCLTRSSACGHTHVRRTLSSLAQIISFPPLHFGWVPFRPSCATRCRFESLWQGKQQPCLRKRKLRLDTTHNIFILQKAILFTQCSSSPSCLTRKGTLCRRRLLFFIFIFIISHVYYSYAGSFCHIYYILYLLFLCRLLVSTFLFWQAWLPFHLLIISCFPGFIYFCFSWHIFLLSKELTCFKESTRMSKQTSVGQVSSTTGTLTHWGWTILSYEDLF